MEEVIDHRSLTKVGLDLDELRGIVIYILNVDSNYSWKCSI